MALCVNEAKMKMKDFFKVCCKNDDIHKYMYTMYFETHFMTIR